jgi:hypothetical protein
VGEKGDVYDFWIFRFLDFWIFGFLDFWFLFACSVALFKEEE